MKIRLIAAAAAATLIFLAGCAGGKTSSTGTGATATADLAEAGFEVIATDATVSANLINNGTACEYDGSVYFSGAAMSGGLSGVYKMNKDGTGVVRIYDSGGTYLNAADGYLYFETDEGIVKLKTDGSESKVLYRWLGSHTFGWLKVSNGNIYYKEDVTLKKIDINGQNFEFVISDEGQTALNAMAFLNLYDGVIYWQDVTPLEDMGTIWSYDLKSQEKKLVRSGIKGLYGMIVTDGSIYYLERNLGDKKECKISRIGLAGGEPAVVYTADQNIYDLNMDKNAIYFIKTDEKSATYVCRIGMDGSGETAVGLSGSKMFDGGAFVFKSDKTVFQSNLNLIGGAVFFDNYKDKTTNLHMLEATGAIE